MHLSARAASKWLFVMGLLKENLETPKARTSAISWGYNFVLRPQIETRSQAKL
jgi:hypothetical protein